MSIKVGFLAQNHFVQATHNILSIMEHSKATVESLLDDVPLVFLVIEASGRIVRSNHCAAKFFFCHMDDTLGRSVLELFKPETGKIFMVKTTDLPTFPARTTEFELAIDARGSPMEYSWSVHPFFPSRNVSEVCYAIFGTDVSELRKCQRAIKAKGSK